MGEAFIVKSRDAWIEQGRLGTKVMEKYPDKKLREVFAITMAQEDKTDYQALCGMVEALIAFGLTVSQEIKDLAMIRPVNEVLGLP